MYFYVKRYEGVFEEDILNGYGEHSWPNWRLYKDGWTMEMENRKQYGS